MVARSMTPSALSNETLDELLAAAEKAGGREWFTDPKPTKEGLAVVDDGASMWPIKAEWPQGQFIALANPATLTALITELLSYRSEGATVRDAVLDAIERMYMPTSKPTYGDMVEAVCSALDALYHSTERAETIEECARVADKQAAEDEANWNAAGRDEDARSHYLWAMQTGKSIAAAIRALNPRDGGGQ